MSSESTPLTGSGTVTPPPRRWWGCWLALAAVVLGLGVGLGVWFWPRTPPLPPEPDLSDVDPEVAEAIVAAQNKVRQQPNSGAVWGRLGMVLLVHDFHDEAQSCFAQAELLDPADARWPYLRGLILTRTDAEAGIACLQRAAERCDDKDVLEPRLHLAETLVNQGRLDEAEVHLEWARTAEPHSARVQLGLGRIAMLRGQWRTALEYLDPCTSDVHTCQLAHALRAEAWTRLGEPKRADEEQRLARQAPEDQLWPDPFVEDVLRLQRGLSVRLQRANELFTHRRYPEAMHLLEETIQRYPDATAARLLLGDFWRRLKREEQAEQVFAEAVRIDPNSVEGWFRLGSLQAARHHPRAAADSFRRTIRLKADHADAHVNLGQCLREMGDAAGAAEAFREALRCRPGYERARQALGELEKWK